MQINLNEEDYRNKVYGGWMGKNIGGTLGGPPEGRTELLDLTFYAQKFDGPMPNDDLDLQLVWLHALEQYGVNITSEELAQEWAEHVFFPFDEYGYALTNIRRGIRPPLCGAFNNPFTNCMGSPIRSEIWAMVSPGLPEAAARFAYCDAVVDHAGGEGVYGEIFFAAVESAAFLEGDRDRLLDIGMSCIPPDCRTYKALADLRKWHREGRDWKTARELVLEHHGRENFTDAPQNIAFTVLGWLYGENFGDAILKAVNCGYDTDCTGATLGSILGIIGGAESIPQEWIRPIGEDIKVSPAVKGFRAPKNLKELTERTVQVAKKVLAVYESPVAIISGAETNAAGLKMNTEPVKALWDLDFRSLRQFIPAGTKADMAVEVIIGFQDGHPAIGNEEEKRLEIRLCNHSEAEWKGILALSVPRGWNKSEPESYRLQPGEEMVWHAAVRSDCNVCETYPVAVEIRRDHDVAPWTSYSVACPLVPAWSWTVVRCVADGKPEMASVSCPGNRIAFEQAFPDMEDGMYYAGARLYIPSDRVVKLIGATSGASSMTLDGEVLFNAGKTCFMPAYHRAPRGQQKEVLLTKGYHTISIEVQKDGETLEYYFIPAAPGKTSTPGDSYHYNDILVLGK